MSSAKPTRKQADLADVLELILDKGIVINADIAITVGDTEMLGVELRAAIASFETAAEYGLAFPSGTDMRRVEAASGREPLEEGEDGEPIDLGIDASSGGETPQNAQQNPPRKRPDPETPIGDDGTEEDGKDEADEAEREGSVGDADEDDADGNEAGENEADEAEGAAAESGTEEATAETGGGDAEES